MLQQQKVSRAAEEGPGLEHVEQPPLVNTAETLQNLLLSTSLDNQSPLLGSTFSLFSDLPAELRIKIWKHAHPGPRAITISLPRFQTRLSYLQAAQDSNSLPIALLLVNHEARNTLLEEYQLLFQKYKWGYHFRQKQWVFKQPKWQFNFEKDTLCIASGLKGLQWFLRLFPKDMARVQYLDLKPDGHAFHNEQPLDWSRCSTKVADMKALKLITIRDISTPGRQQSSSPPTIPWVYVANTVDALRVALRSHGGVKIAVRFNHDDLFWCVSMDDRYMEFYHRDGYLIGNVSEDVWERWKLLGLSNNLRKRGGRTSTFQAFVPESSMK